MRFMPPLQRPHPMHGNAAGDRYEGEWRHGLEHGIGTFLAADGSAYYGNWSEGKLHGKGVYKPEYVHGGEDGAVFLREYVQGVLKGEERLPLGRREKQHKREELARKGDNPRWG